jgi:hypothetical protein
MGLLEEILMGLLGETLNMGLLGEIGWEILSTDGFVNE